MQVSKLQAVGALISTVVLGAIGSGLWERVFAPITSWGSRMVMTAFTLGMKSAVDSIYTRVAQGHSEAAASATFIFISYAFIAIPTILAWLQYRRDFSGSEDIGKDGMLHESIEKQVEYNKRKLMDLNSRLAFLNRLIYGLCTACLIMGIFIFSQAVTFSYANKAIVNFDQSLAIIAPYISDIEAKRFQAQFAQINSRLAYVSLQWKIQEIADTNHVKLPAFVIW